jgi:flagellar biosynthesis/type III secretory pathway protein FliH
MTIAEQLFEEGFAQGLEEGREERRKERREEGRIAALRTILVSRFGAQALDAAYDGRLQAATVAAIDRYLDRVGVVESLAAVFED